MARSISAHMAQSALDPTALARVNQAINEMDATDLVKAFRRVSKGLGGIEDANPVLREIITAMDDTIIALESPLWEGDPPGDLVRMAREVYRSLLKLIQPK